MRDHPYFLFPPIALSKIVKAQREIAENPLKLFSLSSLAKMLDWSPSWLSSKFKMFSGITLQSFLIKMRCCFALWQIISTDKQIKALALKAGYKPLYFSQLFSKLFKVSPSSIRSFYPLLS